MHEGHRDGLAPVGATGSLGAGLGFMHAASCSSLSWSGTDAGVAVTSLLKSKSEGLRTASSWR